MTGTIGDTIRFETGSAPTPEQVRYFEAKAAANGMPLDDPIFLTEVSRILREENQDNNAIGLRADLADAPALIKDALLDALNEIKQVTDDVVRAAEARTSAAVAEQVDGAAIYKKVAGLATIVAIAVVAINLASGALTYKYNQWRIDQVAIDIAEAGRPAVEKLAAVSAQTANAVQRLMGPTVFAAGTIASRIRTGDELDEIKRITDRQDDCLERAKTNVKYATNADLDRLGWPPECGDPAKYRDIVNRMRTTKPQR